MRSVEINENDLSNLHSIALELFSQSDDPGSPGYKRVLVRPKISWWRIGLHCFLPIAGGIGLYFLLTGGGMQSGLALVLTLAALGLYGVFSLKRVLICLIRLYQRYAPDSIRNKCRFEPSCSEYMRLCLEKYGVLKGLPKGVNRLKRCNIHNGGYDFP